MVNRVVPAVFGIQLNSVLELVSQMFYQAMISSHQALAEEAVTATSSFIISLEVPGVRQRMNDLLPHMISVREGEGGRERERGREGGRQRERKTSLF